ncbi:hypothetical protein K9U37_10520 [Mycolicibacterium litorale]|uniref:Terminase small subunit n=2 Tax=Candidatus Mycolicibacterium alkanivorans TaxID=2954114 RepID=A0ABS9YY86_9MYCO|nr:hypothetical protein [Candidatus Mycolicibacterium alkanivorans]
MGEPPAETQGDDRGSFPRAYVERLRDENAKYRQRAQHADDLARRLFTELVRSTGRLADPDDLPYDPELLDDPDKLTAAIGALIERRPHYAARRPSGDVGQGAKPGAGKVDLAAILRQRAG